MNCFTPTCANGEIRKDKNNNIKEKLNTKGQKITLKKYKTPTNSEYRRIQQTSEI